MLCVSLSPYVPFSLFMASLGPLHPCVNEGLKAHQICTFCWSIKIRRRYRVNVVFGLKYDFELTENSKSLETIMLDLNILMYLQKPAFIYCEAHFDENKRLYLESSNKSYYIIFPEQ